MPPNSAFDRVITLLIAASGGWGLTGCGTSAADDSGGETAASGADGSASHEAGSGSGEAGSGSGSAGGSSSAEDGSGEGGSDTGGSASLCDAWSNKVASCYGEPQFAGLYALYCELYLYCEYVDRPICLGATRDALVCILNYPCDQLENACADAYAAQEAACANVPPPDEPCEFEPENQEACPDYVAALEACYGMQLPEYTLSECNHGLANSEALGCGEEHVDYLACLSALDCEQLQTETGCEAERALYQDCESALWGGDGDGDVPGDPTASSSGGEPPPDESFSAGADSGTEPDTGSTGP